MTSTEERVISTRYCLRGHDTWIVGRANRWCNKCRRAALNRAQARYERTAAGMLSRARYEALRRGSR